MVAPVDAQLSIQYTTSCPLFLAGANACAEACNRELCRRNLHRTPIIASPCPRETTDA